jgi:ferredoxin
VVRAGQVVIDKTLCYGCNFCMNVCPRNAIIAAADVNADASASMGVNSPPPEGFERPENSPVDCFQREQADEAHGQGREAPGFERLGKQSGGLFSARTGRQAPGQGFKTTGTSDATGTNTTSGGERHE